MVRPQSPKGFGSLAGAQEPGANHAERKDDSSRPTNLTSSSREIKIDVNRAPKVSQLEVKGEVNYDEKKDNPADHDERCGCSSCVRLRRAIAEGSATHFASCLQCNEEAPGHNDGMGLFYCEECWKTHADIIIPPRAAPVTASRTCSSCGFPTNNLLLCDSCLRLQYYASADRSISIGGEVEYDIQIPNIEDTKVQDLMQDYDDVLGTDPYGFCDGSPRAATPDTEPPVSCNEDTETIVEDKPDDDITFIDYKVEEAGNTSKQQEGREADEKTTKDPSNRENLPLSCAGDRKSPSSGTKLLEIGNNTKTPSPRKKLLEIEGNQQKAPHNPWSSNKPKSSTINKHGVDLVQALIRDFSMIKKTRAPSTT